MPDHTIRIVSNDQTQSYVRCVVVEYSQTKAVQSTACLGHYTLVDPQTAKYLSIQPIDGHWSTTVEYKQEIEEIVCSKIAGDPDHPWWQQLVTCESQVPRSAAKIKIGIIDLLYEPLPELQHVHFVDPDAWKQTVSNDGKKQLHGRRVSAIIGGRGPGNFAGIASTAEIFFVDASCIGAAGWNKVDLARVVDGIRALSEVHRVDIINLSCGFGQRRLGDIEDRIEDAADLGTLCICAGGNSAGEPVETPANLATTIGVGGLGFTEIAPPDCVMGELAKDATEAQELGAQHPGWPGQPFHDRRMSQGPGINVSAPSVGVIVQTGQQTDDLSGTSFASPIVASVLACELSKDAYYLGSSGRARYDLAREKLISPSPGRLVSTRKRSGLASHC